MENIKLKGEVTYDVTRANGETETFTDNNLIVNAGLAEITNLISGIGGTAFTYLATGSDNTAAAAAQTALLSENSASGSARASATVTRETTTVTNDTLQLVHTWTFTGNITVGEVGIFNAASAGVMLGRQVPTSKNFENGDTLQITYKVIFS